MDNEDYGEFGHETASKASGNSMNFAGRRVYVPNLVGSFTGELASNAFQYYESPQVAHRQRMKEIDKRLSDRAERMALALGIDLSI